MKAASMLLILLAATGIDIDFKPFIAPVITGALAYFAATRKKDRSDAEKETDVRRDIRDGQNNYARMEKEVEKLRFENSTLVGRVSELHAFIEVAKEDHRRLAKLEEELPKQFAALATEMRTGLEKIGTEMRGDLKGVNKLLTRLEVKFAGSGFLPEKPMLMSDEKGTVDTGYDELNEDGTKKTSWILGDQQWQPKRQESHNDRMLAAAESKLAAMNQADRRWTRVRQISEVLLIVGLLLGVRGMLQMKQSFDDGENRRIQNAKILDSINRSQFAQQDSLTKSLNNQKNGLAGIAKLQASVDSVLEGKKRSKVPTFKIETQAIVTPGKKVEFQLPRDSLHKAPKN